MNHPTPRALVHGAVRVQLWTGAGNTVRFSGVMREVEVGTWLVPLIEDIHRAAIELEMSEVVVDIRSLEYANAALWRCLVGWLKSIHQASDARYNLRLIADPARAWQKIGVPTLRVFGTDSSGVERLIVEGLGN